MGQRRTTQLVIETDVAGTNERRVTQLVLEADIALTFRRRITQVLLEVELVDPYTPPPPDVFPEDIPWSPALLPHFGDPGVEFDPLYVVGHASVMEIGPRRQWIKAERK